MREIIAENQRSKIPCQSKSIIFLIDWNRLFFQHVKSLSYITVFEKRKERFNFVYKPLILVRGLYIV